MARRLTAADLERHEVQAASAIVVLADARMKIPQMSWMADAHRRLSPCRSRSRHETASFAEDPPGLMTPMGPPVGRTGAGRDWRLGRCVAPIADERPTVP